MNTSLPAVGVLSNLPLGQPIPGAEVNVSVPITCTNYTFQAGSVWRISGPMSFSTAYPNVYTADGMPSGIGFQIKDRSGTAVSASGANFIVSNDAPDDGITLNFSFTLVKLSNSIAQASGTLTWDVNVNSQQYANVGSSAQSKVSLAITIQRPNIPTCNPSNPASQVNLPPVLTSDFKGIDSTAGTKGFTINLLCEASAAPSITFSDSTQPANASSIISLAAGSSASGVAVQLMSNNAPVLLSPGGQAAAGGTVITPPSSGSAQTMSIPLIAQYIQSEQKVTPGHVTGIATFTLSYQ